MKLDASKSAGALLGVPVAQLVCSALRYFGHVPVDPATEAEITAVVVFALSHLIPSQPGPTAPKA